jgi:hypothetical protein
MLIDGMKVTFLKDVQSVEADFIAMRPRQCSAMKSALTNDTGKVKRLINKVENYSHEWSNESIRVGMGSIKTPVKIEEKEIPKSPPLKGVHPKMGPRKKREVLLRRRIKEMEKKKVSQMFEEENKIMNKYGIVKEGDIWEGRSTTWTDPYFTHNKMKELKNEKESELEEGLPPPQVI